LIEALLIITFAVALTFDFTNGFHDTPMAVSTAISTRALSPRRALLIAAVLNLAGAVITVVFFQAKVSNTISKLLVIKAGLVLLLAALLGAILWNLTTWYFGLPSSSSHAFIGGFLGAAIAAGGEEGARYRSANQGDEQQFIGAMRLSAMLSRESDQDHPALSQLRRHHRGRHRPGHGQVGDQPGQLAVGPRGHGPFQPLVEFVRGPPPVAGGSPQQFAHPVPVIVRGAQLVAGDPAAGFGFRPAHSVEQRRVPGPPAPP